MSPSTVFPVNGHRPDRDRCLHAAPGSRRTCICTRRKTHSMTSTTRRSNCSSTPHRLGFQRARRDPARQGVRRSDASSPAPQELGILLIPAAELRIEGADVVCSNITAKRRQACASFEDLRRLRARRGHVAARFCAASVLPAGRLHRRADRAISGLFRRHRVLPFSRSDLNPERARRAPGARSRQCRCWPPPTRIAGGSSARIIRCWASTGRRRSHDRSGLRGDPRRPHPARQPLRGAVHGLSRCVFPVFHASLPRPAAGHQSACRLASAGTGRTLRDAAQCVQPARRRHESAIIMKHPSRRLLPCCLPVASCVCAAAKPRPKRPRKSASRSHGGQERSRPQHSRPERRRRFPGVPEPAAAGGPAHDVRYVAVDDDDGLRLPAGPARGRGRRVRVLGPEQRLARTGTGYEGDVYRRRQTTWSPRRSSHAKHDSYNGYRAGIRLENGGWKFAYFVSGQ